MGAMLYIILYYFISIFVVGLDEVVGIYEVPIGGVNRERRGTTPVSQPRQNTKSAMELRDKQTV